MSVRKITEYPEKVLAMVGKPVEKFDEELEKLCEEMYETMYGRRQSSQKAEENYRPGAGHRPHGG